MEYVRTFSTENWKSLTDAQKAEHTLAECKACYLQHGQLQEHFPGKPVYTPILVDLNLYTYWPTKKNKKRNWKKGVNRDERTMERAIWKVANISISKVYA